ncbi:protein lev-9 [Caerostris extrusa]|uniref:Protein lev-9 n=1 Tax=Caerostris extrusa TaxID=172846 RepID=A0AAV4VQW9_CAEEX|nr:protein lev-9 [Caerostris extrusa]
MMRISVRNDDLAIRYTNYALFSCKDRDKQRLGPRRIACLSNGSWSDSPPHCRKVCELLRETEGLRILYTHGLDEGSIAIFHCFAPKLRSGVSRATCKEGQWTDHPPTCTLPSCSLGKIFQVLPENVIPVLDGVVSDTLPFNFTLHLTCEEGLRLSGIDTAKCISDGSWQISRVQCVTGCPNPVKTKDSELLVEPDKDFYRFGESVTLACSPGYVLSSEVVRLMCLGSNWSETELPHCEEEWE